MKKQVVIYFSTTFSLLNTPVSVILTYNVFLFVVFIKNDKVCEDKREE